MKPDRVFDYIVVGAGSAGCVLANRLTADGAATLALVEAGGPDTRQEIHIPAAFSKLFKSDCDWAYFTEEQAGLDGRRLYWPRGKVLGGSSSMNAMIYTHGSAADFDEWASRGNDGWGYADVRPAFERADGVLGPCSLRSPNPLSRAFLAACEESGIARNDDFNGDAQEGAGFFHVTQRAGKRRSTAVAYLAPAMKRKNLAVFTNTLTTRVLFEGTRAIGIECLRNGMLSTIGAAREVILCGGAINSPQLLMLSGIGKPDELRAAGVSTIATLAGVGENLQDHLASGAVYECRTPVTLAVAESVSNILRYVLFKRGMLTSNVAEAGAFVRTSTGERAPDLEVLFGPTYFMDHGFANPKGHGFTIGAILLHPKSSGSIRLRSSDPTAAPVIQPQYLSDRRDAVLLREGVRLCRRIASAHAFDEARGAEVWPGTSSQSDAEIDAFIRGRAETLYHPVGTCRMGNDDLAVVDARLRVRGVASLRVADASVMPSIVSAHPNAAVVMIAERAAEMIAAG